MTAPAPATTDFAVLDRRILDALGELRTARGVVARRSTRTNVERRARAEDHLNALLEYRHAARHEQEREDHGRVLP